MGPVVSEVRNAGYRVETRNVRSNQAMAGEFNVRSVPTFVYMLDGKEVRRKTGYQSAESLKGMWRGLLW